MKRLALFAAILALCGCTRSLPVTKVTFEVRGVSSGSLTKSLASDVGALLDASAPTGTPTLSIRSTTNSARVYSASVGAEITLPLDTYTITGDYTPSSSIIDVVGGYAYAEPTYRISTTATIGESTSSVPLDATYTCIALIGDFSECTEYWHTRSNNDDVTVTGWVRSGNLGVIYIRHSDGSWDTAHPYRVTALPVDLAEHERATFNLTDALASGCIAVENGRWYRFSPSEVETASGVLGINFPAWEQGN